MCKRLTKLGTPKGEFYRGNIMKKHNKLSVTILVLFVVAVLGGCKKSQNFISDTEIEEIHEATRQREFDKIKSLLSKKPALANAKDSRGHSPLHVAAQNGDRKAAELLISKQAVVDLKDDSGYTPLHRAAGLGHKDVVSLLISKGMDVNSKEKRGNTPLHFVADKATAELLIRNGADVNSKNETGQTPLYLAAVSNRKELVEFLVSSGADVNAKDNNGHTALYQALHKYYNTEMANLLRKHGGVE